MFVQIRAIPAYAARCAESTVSDAALSEVEDARRISNWYIFGSARIVFHQYRIVLPDQLLVMRPASFLYQLFPVDAHTLCCSSFCWLASNSSITSRRRSMTEAPPSSIPLKQLSM